MMRQYVKLFSCVTIFLLPVIFRYGTIYPLSSKCLEVGQIKTSDREPNAVREGEDGSSNVKLSRKNVDSVNMANSARGVEYFKDSVEVLGMNFTQTVVVDMCNAHLFVTADIVSDVVFPDEGRKLCDRVCVQYVKLMKFDGLTDVFLVKGYCEYIGTTDFSDISEPDDQYDLNTACTCLYKVPKSTKVIMYTFRANSDGFLTVSFSEPDQKLIRRN